MISGIYFVTDAQGPKSVLAQINAAVVAGVRIIQLRDKNASDAEMIALARDLQPMLRAVGCQFIINDRVEVALACGSDGLHVGQSDGDVAAVRDRIGPDMTLGLSIENPGQVAAIPLDVVDYIGAGPVRATDVKPDHAPPIGFDGLAGIAKIAPCPTIAIGGLTADDVGAVRASGCVGMAVVSTISRTPDMRAAATSLLSAWSVT